MIRRYYIDIIFILLILLLAFYLRIDDVGEKTVRFDEAFSVWLSNMAPANFTERTARDVHPPLYYWLFAIWTRLTGTSEFAIRAIAVLFSAITAAAVYCLARRLSKSRLAATLALLLIALSPFHIHWSQDARMYAQATMFAALALYACWRQRQGLLIIAGIGVTLTHYFGAIILLVIILHRLLHWRELRRGRREFLIALAVIAAVCLLWFAYAYGLIRQDAGYARFQPIFTFQLMATLFAVNQSIDIDSQLPATLLISACFFAGILLAWRAGKRRAASLILLACLLPPAVISAVALPFFPFHVNWLSERYFVIFAPIVYAGWGIGLHAMLNRRRLRVIGIAAAIGLIILSARLTAQLRDARYYQDDYRSMMAAVAALTSADEKVFVISGGYALQVFYYLDQAGYDAPKDENARYIHITGVPSGYVEDLSAMMEDVFFGATRFWLIEIEAAGDQPPGARLQWIADRYHRIFRIPVGHNGISLYSIDPTDEIPESAAFIPPVIREARPGDQIRIGVPAGVRVDLVHSGQVIDTKTADTWMLHQFDIHPYYFNGVYELQAADERHRFVITHSRDFPGGGG